MRCLKKHTKYQCLGYLVETNVLKDLIYCSLVFSKTRLAKLFSSTWTAVMFNIHNLKVTINWCNTLSAYVCGRCFISYQHCKNISKVVCTIACIIIIQMLPVIIKKLYSTSDHSTLVWIYEDILKARVIQATMFWKRRVEKKTAEKALEKQRASGVWEPLLWGHF